jgi:hypothetical protein
MNGEVYTITIGSPARPQGPLDPGRHWAGDDHGHHALEVGDGQYPSTNVVSSHYSFRSTAAG